VKKVLVVGAGGQGGPCASILARDKDISGIVLGDIDLDLANKVKEYIGSNKITAVKINAGEIEEIAQAAQGVDAIINLAPPQCNTNVMKAALRSGAHYVDAALDYPAMAQLTERKPPELDNEFKKAGLTALIACGGTPGLSNVLVKYVCDKFDQLDSICLRCSGPITKKPKDIIRAWDPGWAPKTAFIDYSKEPIVFEDGEYKKYPPFSGREEYDFTPFGKVLVAHHLHEEAAMLPYFIGKGLKYVDFKFPADIQAGCLVQQGFASDKLIDIKGIKISPWDVLEKLVRTPVNAFFTEEEVAKSPVDFDKSYVIKVKGTKSGSAMEYTLSFPYPLFVTTEERLEVFRRFGTINIYVALPAIVGAKMCVEGKASKGTIGPECLDPLEFLKGMAAMDCPVKLNEVVSRGVVIK